MSIVGEEFADKKQENEKKAALDAQIRKMKSRQYQRESSTLGNSTMMMYSAGGAVVAIAIGLVIASGSSASDIATIIGKRLWYASLTL
jgi:hypothetical protein